MGKKSNTKYMCECVCNHSRKKSNVYIIVPISAISHKAMIGIYNYFPPQLILFSFYTKYHLG